MTVSECVTTLLFPFQWQHIYLPIVSAHLYHLLDAPVPFLMGIQRRDRAQRSSLHLPHEVPDQTTCMCVNRVAQKNVAEVRPFFQPLMRDNSSTTSGRGGFRLSTNLALHRRSLYAALESH